MRTWPPPYQNTRLITPIISVVAQPRNTACSRAVLIPSPSVVSTAAEKFSASAASRPKAFTVRTAPSESAATLAASAAAALTALARPRILRP